jgi:hypothetical protein
MSVLKTSSDINFKVTKRVVEKSPTPTEHFEQREFVKWFRQTYTLKQGVRIFAVPNGGLRGKTEALKLKCEGVSAGVPDLCVPEWGLWVEMKRQKGGVVSPEQKDWHEYLKKIGHTVIIGYGLEDAKAKVLEFKA